jgi:NAD(P)H-hydrate epimerase
LAGSILTNMLRLTREQVREIDRRAIEDFHIPGIVLMENAARAVVDATMEMLGNPVGVVSIICGGGNNGGDGLAVARHLTNRGFHVTACIMVDPSTLMGDALTNYRIASKIWRVNRWQYVEQIAGLLAPAGKVGVRLIVDAIFGTGLTRAPVGDYEAAINQINSFGIPVLAVDVPSGLDCDTGLPLGTCIRAQRTVTFVAEKAGFDNPRSKEYTGEVTVGDIGVPRELIDKVAKMKPT